VTVNKKKWLTCLGGIVLVLMCGVAALIAAWFLGINQFQNSPRLVEDFSFPGQPRTGYLFSDQQKEWIIEHGYPPAFTILFYQEEAPDGGVWHVRQEIWYYFDSDQQVTFLNGGFVAVEPSVLTGGKAQWGYHPDMFTMFMSRAQLAQATGINDWMIVPVEDALVPDAEVYYADGLTFGFKHDKLIYVEAFAGE
jgi:hypothetical protein